MQFTSVICIPSSNFAYLIQNLDLRFSVFLQSKMVKDTHTILMTKIYLLLSNFDVHHFKQEILNAPEFQ